MAILLLFIVIMIIAIEDGKTDGIYKNEAWHNKLRSLGRGCYTYREMTRRGEIRRLTEDNRRVYVVDNKIYDYNTKKMIVDVVEENRKNRIEEMDSIRKAKGYDFRPTALRPDQRNLEHYIKKPVLTDVNDKMFVFSTVGGYNGRFETDNGYKYRYIREYVNLKNDRGRLHYYVVSKSNEIEVFDCDIFDEMEDIRSKGLRREFDIV